MKKFKVVYLTIDAAVEIIEETKHHYLSFLVVFESNFMNRIPEDGKGVIRRVNDDLLPKLTEYDHCSDLNTLLQTLKLWRETVDLFSSSGNKPFPPIRRIVSPLPFGECHSII
jgi:hypothetical protein